VEDRSQTSPAATRLAVGLAVGEGTGPELALAFESAIAALGAASGVAVEIVRSAHVFRTFGALAAGGADRREIERASEHDAGAYEAFLRDLAARGCGVAFRTAFNAQPLYEVRERLACVKVETLPGSGGETMLVRDEAQGFYGGENDRDGPDDAIRRTCRFSKDVTFRVLDFARGAAAARWGGPDRIDHTILAYKFHLLDGRFASWIAEYARARDARVRVFQPDTVNRHLLRGGFRGNLLLVAANEWGDIMHADLLARSGLGAQEERCSRNVYLAPGLERFVEYQTVHGSADDIAGRGEVNPGATLRAAARILEEHAGAAGLEARLERAIEDAAARGFATPDRGGRASTSEVVEHVLAALREPPPRPRAREDRALVVVDVQNDFCARGGRFARLGLVDPERTEALARRLHALVAAAREGGIPVIFVRTFGDEHLLPPNVAARNRRSGRAGLARSSEWGSHFCEVAPLPGEKVVTKCGYDAFLGTDLAEHLRAAGVGRLVLAGVFTEVCVDALARTAYQSGFGVTLVEDGTLPLERDQESAAAFMARYYDAATATAEALAREWRALRAADRTALAGLAP
jgi:nicotinamidase-related amidase/isocitrate/isopropylmalate dehydrogenase